MAKVTTHKPTMTATQFQTIRERLGLSHKELADKLELPPEYGWRTIDRYEKGISKIAGPVAQLMRIYARKKGK